jgi:hypothetical protein
MQQQLDYRKKEIILSICTEMRIDQVRARHNCGPTLKSEIMVTSSSQQRNHMTRLIDAASSSLLSSSDV